MKLSKEEALQVIALIDDLPIKQSYGHMIEPFDYLAQNYDDHPAKESGFFCIPSPFEFKGKFSMYFTKGDYYYNLECLYSDQDNSKYKNQISGEKTLINNEIPNSNVEYNNAVDKGLVINLD